MPNGLRTVVVMGMHRSATSMAARALHESGEVWMGHDLYRDWPGSPKGLYEHRPVVLLNMAVLAAAGGDWNRPPSRDRILAVGPQFSEQIESVIADLEEGAIQHGMSSVGFKDPRLCLTIELFVPYLTAPQYITPFRDHRAVAESLHERDGMPLEEGVELSKEYSHRLLEFLSRTFDT